jgi:hypothetical protein
MPNAKGAISRSCCSFLKTTVPALFVLMFGALVCAAQSDRSVGTPWTGARGVRERTSDIMQREAQAGRHQRPYLVHLRETTELVEHLENNPDSPVFAEMSGPLTASSSSIAQSTSVSFLGATLSDTHAYPPDSMGAVGPAQYIVAVNGRIRSFNKATGAADGVINADTDVFFNPVLTPPANNNFTSDPRIRYDRLSGRWFIIMIDVPGQAGLLPNRVMLAVSDGSVITPSSVWTFYYFQHDLVSPAGDTGEFADYPTLGIDASALYIGVNIFKTTGLGSFDNTTAFVVRKSSLLITNNSPTNIVVTAFRNLIPNGNAGGPYTPQGVDNYDPAATEGFIIGINSQVYGKISLRRISDPGGTPSISGNTQITIPLNGGTINVPHLGNTGGTAGNLDGLDYRLLAAHVRNGHLWTSANVAVDNTGSPSGTDTRMGVNWYELTGIATGQTPSVVQSGIVFEPSASNTTTNRCYWMGTVMVSGQGHAAMGLSVAGANEYINAGTVGRLKNDAAGTMRTPVLYTATSSTYNPVDSGGAPINRWGDYSYTCLDPDDDMTMWTIQEFCNANNSYGVQIAKLLAPAPATPAVCSPATLAPGMSNVNVTLTGASAGDTGFFDPGAGFSNRLAAAISGGGVTVNSVTYNNPTNITLDISVSLAAALGVRMVTVINPDGQSATNSTDILFIVINSNNPPVLAAITNRTINELALLTFTNSASDPDGNALTFSLDAGAPTNAVINLTNGVFTWTPTEAQGPSTNPITVRVTDNGTPNLSATQSFTVIVSEVNTAPSLAAITNKTVVESLLLTFTNSASDADVPANVLTFSFDAGAPTNAIINPTNGVFTWTPTEVQGPGTNTISVIVTDNGTPSLSATQSFTVVVLESNLPPVLAAITNYTIHAGTTFVFTNSATDPDLPLNILTFSLDSAAPAGAGINATNGIFTWPTSAEDANTTNSITVRVTDNGVPNLSDAKSFLVTVVAPPTIGSTVVSNGILTMLLDSIPGQTYHLQENADLTTTNWTDVTNFVADGSTTSVNVPINGADRKFYRLVILP